MAKATAADVQALGFDAKQFGTPANFSTYLDDIITDVAAEVTARVGTTAYADGNNTKRLKWAEIYFTAAELWRRRKAFLDRAGAASDTAAAVDLIAEYERNAQQSDAMAEKELALISSSVPDSGLAVGYVETGPYSEVGA